MSKKKALIICTISVEPHNPADRVEIEVAHAGRDTEEILAALVVEKFRGLVRGKKFSVETGRTDGKKANLTAAPSQSTKRRIVKADANPS